VTTQHARPAPQELAEQWEEETPPAAGPIANLVTAAVVIAVAVVGVIGSLALGTGSPESPAAGTWPLVLSVLLLVLGVTLAATARTTHDGEKFGKSSWLVLGGLATVPPFAALLPVIGFEIPSAVLAFVWLRFLGREGWRVSVLGALAMVVAFYLIFVVALGATIPHLF
jgi:hypothetical protein